MSEIDSFELQRIQERLARPMRPGFHNAGASGIRALDSIPSEKLAQGLDLPYTREMDLHEDILSECRTRGWIALHGSMAEATHRTEGEWDFVIIADYGRVFLIECKTAKGKLTPEQAGMKAWAEKLGHAPKVVRSFSEFMDAIK